MIFDVLIIGGGAAGMSCALVLGSAYKKPYAKNKNIGIIIHQKESALARGLFNNVLGMPTGTTGKEIMEEGRNHLAKNYPHVVQIENEKVIRIEGEEGNFTVTTHTNSYASKTIVIAVGASNTFHIEGLMEYTEPHRKLPKAKNRIQLKNTDHKVKDGIYVAGILAGWRSQFAMAAGSGAHVATDILTEWNGGKPAMIHDAVK